MAQLPALEARQLTASMQDYAKAIFTLETRDGSASTTALAALLDVQPGSVSGMLRKLSSLDLVEHEPYHGVRLTERGRRVAPSRAWLQRPRQLFRQHLLLKPKNQTRRSLKLRQNQGPRKKLRAKLQKKSPKPSPEINPNPSNQIIRRRQSIIMAPSTIRPLQRRVAAEKPIYRSPVFAVRMCSWMAS